MSRRKVTNEFDISMIMNNYSYVKIFNQLEELALSMFEWKNLPNTVDPRYLEKALFERGKAVFFNDEGVGFVALQVTDGGKRNIYNVPEKRHAYASNGYNNYNLDENNSVIIYNNYLRTSTAFNMRYYACRLWNLDRIIDVNANAQKTPILIVCDENERLSMEQVYMQYNGNQPVIYANKALSSDGIKVLNTDAPYLGDKLMQLKNQIWNEALTELGISNLNIQKKERVVQDEVVKAQGGTIANRYSRLNARQEAAKKINELFGLNIEVEYRDDFRIFDKNMEEVETEEKEEEGEDNE